MPKTSGSMILALCNSRCTLREGVACDAILVAQEMRYVSGNLLLSGTVQCTSVTIG